MHAGNADNQFSGSIAELYEAQLVPLIFAPYADDMAHRVAARKPRRVLEIAAGTGVVTRAMAMSLPPDVDIVATDLNQPMLDQAVRLGTWRPVQWRQADAMHLPFDDASFDLVLCQFGAMFFPDKARAFAQARRVLRAGGALIFSVWDRIEENDFADVITSALQALYPQDPPRFLARTPHGYHDDGLIAADLERAGFESAPMFDTLAARSKAASAGAPAIAYCQGTPLRNEIVARGTPGLVEATTAAARAIAARFGAGAVDGAIRAHIVSVDR